MNLCELIYLDSFNMFIECLHLQLLQDIGIFNQKNNFNNYIE